MAINPTERAMIVGSSKEISVTKALAAAANYGADDVLSENALTGTVWTFADAGLDLGGEGIITKVVVVAETTLLVIQLDLFLYNAAPTCNLNDNVVSDQVLFADASQYLGKVVIPALAADVAGAAAVAVATQATPSTLLPLPYVCGASLKDIYGVVTSPVAFTNEVAGESLTIKLQVERF